MQQDKKIQTALKELEAVSHKGSYQEWLSKNKAMLGELKIKNPIAYTTFMEDFQSTQNQSANQRSYIMSDDFNTEAGGHS